MTNVTFDVGTNDFENRPRALEGELEMIDQDISGKLVDVVEEWEEYVRFDGESERYRFGGGGHHKLYPRRSSRYEVRCFTNY